MPDSDQPISHKCSYCASSEDGISIKSLRNNKTRNLCNSCWITALDAVLGGDNVLLDIKAHQIQIDKIFDVLSKPHRAAAL